MTNLFERARILKLVSERAEKAEAEVARLSAERRRVEGIFVDILCNGWDSAKPRVLPKMKQFVEGPRYYTGTAAASPAIRGDRADSRQEQGND